MKKYRFLSFFLLLTMLLSIHASPAFALEPLDLECKNAILVDANYNEILSEKYAHDKAYPASITKVTTALLVLEAVEAGKLTLDTMVPKPSNAFNSSTASSLDFSTGKAFLPSAISIVSAIFSAPSFSR